MHSSILKIYVKSTAKTNIRNCDSVYRKILLSFNSFHCTWRGVPNGDYTGLSAINLAISIICYIASLSFLTIHWKQSVSGVQYWIIVL